MTVLILVHLPAAHSNCISISSSSYLCFSDEKFTGVQYTVARRQLIYKYIQMDLQQLLCNKMLRQAVDCSRVCL